MGANTKIEWADDTVNFWHGCTQISPACDHCYAKDIAERFGSAVWNGPPSPRLAKAGLELAAIDRLAAKEGRKRFVFINSMGDTFDNQATEQWRADLFAAIEAAPNIIALVLTKRVGNVMGMLKYSAPRWPSNAWLGITVCNQEEADRDIPKLLAAKAALGIPKVFISVEPMLGPVDLARIPNLKQETGRTDWGGPLPTYSAFKHGLDWVICGGESGHQARPMHPEWPRQLEYQCQAARVPFFFKQWGEYVPGGHPAALALGDFTMRDAMALSTKGGQFADGQSCWRVGKKAAGRLLDGAEHNGRPQP